MASNFDDGHIIHWGGRKNGIRMREMKGREEEVIKRL